MTLFHKAGLSSYTGADSSYATLGLIRLIGLMAGKKIEDSPEDWKKMSRMSIEVRNKLKELGLFDHGEAIKCRNHLRQALTLRDYTLSDLVIFVCLLPKQH